MLPAMVPWQLGIRFGSTIRPAELSFPRKEVDVAPKSLPTEIDLDALRRFSTPVISNAIETFHARLRNAGFTDRSIHCMYPEEDAPMVGYAATARLRTEEPPIVGGSFHDRTRVRTDSHLSNWGRHGLGIYDTMTESTWHRRERAPSALFEFLGQLRDRDPFK